MTEIQARSWSAAFGSRVRIEVVAAQPSKIVSVTVVEGSMPAEALMNPEQARTLAYALLQAAGGQVFSAVVEDWVVTFDYRGPGRDA
jgi:hypothetical protein